MTELYTIKEKTTGDSMGLMAPDIDAVRKWIYWHKKGGRFDIYKNKRLLGTMYSGAHWWGYDPNTGYDRDYEVLGNGAIRDTEWEG